MHACESVRGLGSQRVSSNGGGQSCDLTQKLSTLWCWFARETALAPTLSPFKDIHYYAVYYLEFIDYTYIYFSSLAFNKLMILLFFFVLS